MAPRSSWKGFLRLSLVSVPVRAFTANNTTEELRLNQLHKECHQRVKYKKVCPEHGELKSDEIVSGYEYGKDQYVVIDPEELAKLRPESDKSVRIDGFVPAADIRPLYLAGKTYYLLPDGPAGNKPYALLHRGMVDGDVWAIAQVVLSGREQLVCLRPVENLLVMSILHVAKKVKPLDEFTKEVPENELTPEELALTGTLIDASRIEDFDFAAYKDAYAERLGQLIQMKVDGQEIVQAPDPEEPKIINLMEALKASVAAARGGSEESAEAEPAPRPARKKAASKTAAGKQTAGTKKKMAPSAGRKKATRRKSG